MDCGEQHGRTGNVKNMDWWNRGAGDDGAGKEQSARLANPIMDKNAPSINCLPTVSPSLAVSAV
jgi:hypothetical protein